MARLLATLSVLLAVVVPTRAQSAASVEYRLSFPEPEHHWMQVDATFPDLAAGPAELRMSRSSPGRYALHEFVKNVYDLRAFDANRVALPAVPSDPYGWRVETQGGALTVSYKVFGDRVDGTYLAVDPTHAHINMPAALVFVRGLDDRPVSLTFVPPRGRDDWRVATQLIPSDTALRFTAPNLQYLMDSPAEFGTGTIQTFVLDGHTFRFAAHHQGSDEALQRLVADVRAIVAEQRKIFGEYPSFEPGHYTFLADYLPYANGDGMEHRNSTVVTSPTSIAEDRTRLLGTVAHEFFHAWNVERIRPRSLEPFNFEAANPSGELWLAEGFTQYYGALTLSRTGLVDLTETTSAFREFVASVVLSPARLARSAADLSRMAVFTDGARPIDATNWATTYVSYYPYGAAIALALDLTLRDRFDGRVTLDHYMRALWQTHGKPGGRRPGTVDRPYTLADAEARLAEVTESPEFAREFFARYVHGHEAADYDTLLQRAGLLLRRRRPHEASLGRAEYGQGARGLRIESVTIPGTPLHRAGLDRGDELLELDGRRLDSEATVAQLLLRHAPGDALRALVADRSGTTRTVTVTLVADPSFDVIPFESAGRSLTDAQRTFRRQWLDAQR
ncbi:MAG: M61 family metallopeptidase [Vicinamibacterales bacterium]